MSNRTTGWRSPRHERGERQLRQMIQMLWFGVYLVWEHATRSPVERDRLRILWERGELGAGPVVPEEGNLAEAHLDLLQRRLSDPQRKTSRALRAIFNTERSALLLLTKRCIQSALFVGVGVAQSSTFSEEELAQHAMKSVPEIKIDSAVLRTAATLIAADVLVALTAAQTELGTHRAQRRANRERGT